MGGTSNKPNWNIIGFIGIGVLAVFLLVYATLSGRDIFWTGLIFMLFFFFIIYFIGVYAGNKNDTGLQGMMLAGRSIPLWIGMFSMSATWVGGGYINGTAEATYSPGLVWAQAPWAYAISLIIAGIFYARRMRNYEFTTMIDPLEARFGKKIAAVLFLPALAGEIFWSGAILTALGTTFGTILGLDFTTSIIISAIFAIAYTVVGGMWSVAYTDAVQLSIIIVGLFLIVPFAMKHTGGLQENWTQYVSSIGKNGTNYASFFPPLNGWKDPSWGDKYWQWWDLAFLLLFGGIPWQVYFQRVLSSKSASIAMWLSIMAGGVALIVAVPSMLVGIIGYNADWTALGFPKPENAAMVFPYVLRYLTPSFVAAVGLGALAAAVMSSVDASILSAASMSSWNVYRPLFKPKATAKELGKVIQRAILLVGVAATIIALNVKSVSELWVLCSDFVYCMLFPQLTMALFSKSANWYGSVAGIIVAFILRIGGGEPVFNIPHFLPYPMIHEGVVLFPFRTFAMVCSLITIYVVSKLTTKLSPPVPLHNPRKIT
ncbi:solute carrier family 5 (high affinity choline transporter), member 7 [Marininema mesophilum]|uniref:Solute carrier family 5 (High affinity choline transporter), member 7 n=1 Tax=Marininema mesophilum TaxID=1048340 RepID=A0A1H2SF33_9BACL|nr:sodium:solute symporter family protein [Marininema mesophilum]SDW30165.1 solute carrier family 5 (high affinity choline transporter), member 7 [Marininema mesophilum]